MAQPPSFRRMAFDDDGESPYRQQQQYQQHSPRSPDFSPSRMPPSAYQNSHFFQQPTPDMSRIPPTNDRTNTPRVYFDTRTTDDGFNRPPTEVSASASSRFGQSQSSRQQQHEQQQRDRSTAENAPPPSAAPCLRATYVCTVFLCLLWPALLTAGLILMTEADPREKQRKELSDAVSAFEPLTVVIRESSASTDSQLSGTLPSATGPPAPTGPNGLPLTFMELTPVYEVLPQSGDRSILLQSKDRVVVPENIGPNLGSLTFKVQFGKSREREFSIISPPVTLRKRATKEVFCTPQYATICDTTTCCKDADMQNQCDYLIKSKIPSSSVTFVPDKTFCPLGISCGECQYDQFPTQLCFVMIWSPLTGWRGDSSKSSCHYPFLAGDQTYGDSDKGAILQLRANLDPYIKLQEITSGRGTFVSDNSNRRSNGRGLLLFSIIVLFVLICVVFLSRLCGMSLWSPVSLESAFGVKVGKKSNVDQRNLRHGGNHSAQQQSHQSYLPSTGNPQAPSRDYELQQRYGSPGGPPPPPAMEGRASHGWQQHSAAFSTPRRPPTFVTDDEL